MINSCFKNEIIFVNRYYLFQVELYSGVFTNIDESNSKLVCGPQAGLVLLADKLKVTVMTGSGEQLSAWKWNNPPQVNYYLISYYEVFSNEIVFFLKF